MDRETREKFMTLWRRHFRDAELPITFFFSDDEDCAPRPKAPTAHRCILGPLARVRKGESLSFDAEAAGCNGARRYLGFSAEIGPDFTFFLSHGIPGKVEGERYKRTPGLVEKFLEHSTLFKAPGRFIVFKRWDALDEADEPEGVIFFAPPDVIAGLFTLANFDCDEPNGVFAPFAAGCGTIVQYPYLEKNSQRQRGVLGLFDISARPFVDRNELTISFPMARFLQIVGYMEESFLITPSWEKVKKRI
jgi:uncharacterized protein (DUF169 family)